MPNEDGGKCLLDHRRCDATGLLLSPASVCATVRFGTGQPERDRCRFGTCQQLFVEGKLDSNGRAGSAGAGAAVGVGTAVAGGAAAVGAGPWAGAAVASATVVLLPFAILGGAWGMSRMKRANKERAIKRVMSGCMAERGFQVSGWTKTGKKVAVVPVSR